MKINRLHLWMVLIPLLVSACGGKEPLHDLPGPPVPGKPTTEDPEDPEDPENPGGDTPKPWDVNRGKSVRPSPGSGWTVTNIDGDKGVVYYAFDGKESITKTNQRIFVTDIDLNQDYAVKLAYYSGRNIASRVMSATKALAVINGGYEMGSIWARVNGVNYGTISYDYISGTDPQVPQWKSEAAVYLDQDKDVRIRFTGKGKNLAEWRAIYQNKCTTERNFLTSSPMLIDDYEPVGESFCDLHPKASSQSEDPNVHQGSLTNPRTAIAKTEDNHVLFIVVDGRRNGISRGISAAELTQFLVTNFNPQYALNLDGGGSSTMCVQGQGDPETFVVNYPCDNRSQAKTITIGSETITWPKETNGPDHAGQRNVPTFFYVVKK